MTFENGFNQTVCRELHVYFVSGQVKRTSVSRLVQVLFSARSIFFFLTLSILMLAGNAFDFWLLLPPLAAFLFWPGIFAIYIVLLLVQYFVVALLTRADRTPVVISPIVGFFCLSAALLMCSHCATMFSDGAFPGLSAKEFILFYLASQMVEVLFAQLMTSPQMHRDSDPKHDGTNPADEIAPQEAALVLGDIQVPLADLMVLEADEHYVRIETTRGDMLKRVRMSDLLAQLGPEAGVRPHRSWWVSREACPALKRHDGRQVLELKCGAKVPVARGRLSEVRDWLSAHTLPADTFANEVSKSP